MNIDMEAASRRQWSAISDQKSALCSACAKHISADFANGAPASHLFFRTVKLTCNAGSLKDGKSRIAVGFKSMRAAGVWVVRFPCDLIVAASLAGYSFVTGRFIVHPVILRSHA